MKAPAGVDGGAVTVHVRVALKKVSRVDTVQGTAYVKMGLVFYWTDPRLVGWPDVEDLPQLLWTPVLLLTNTGGTEFYAAPDGLHCIEADTGRLKVMHVGPKVRACRACASNEGRCAGSLVS